MTMNDTRKNDTYYEELFLAWLDGELTAEEERELTDALERGELDDEALRELFAVRSALLEVHAPSPAGDTSVRFERRARVSGGRFMRIALAAAVFVAALTAWAFLGVGPDQRAERPQAGKEAHLEGGGETPSASVPAAEKEELKEERGRKRDSMTGLPALPDGAARNLSLTGTGKDESDADKEPEGNKKGLSLSTRHERKEKNKKQSANAAKEEAEATRARNRRAGGTRRSPAERGGSLGGLRVKKPSGKSADGAAAPGRPASAKGGAVPSLRKAGPAPEVFPLGAKIYHYTAEAEGGKVVVLKAGKIRVGGKRPITVLLPHFGRLEVEKGSVVEIEIRTGGATAGLPGLVLAESARKCEVAVKVLKGKARFTGEDGSHRGFSEGAEGVIVPASATLKEDKR